MLKCFAASYRNIFIFYVSINSVWIQSRPKLCKEFDVCAADYLISVSLLFICLHTFIVRITWERLQCWIAWHSSLAAMRWIIWIMLRRTGTRRNLLVAALSVWEHQEWWPALHQHLEHHFKGKSHIISFPSHCTYNVDLITIASPVWISVNGEFGFQNTFCWHRDSYWMVWVYKWRNSGRT